MKKAILILFILLSPSIIKAQIVIGDVEFKSFEVFFNPENTSYWDEIGAFALNSQQTFIPNFPSMINNRNEQPSIELVIKSNLNTDNVRSDLTRDFNRQFGQPVVIESPRGFQLSNTGWIVEEENEEYIIAFPRDYREGKLIILKVVD